MQYQFMVAQVLEPRYNLNNSAEFSTDIRAWLPWPDKTAIRNRLVTMIEETEQARNESAVDDPADSVSAGAAPPGPPPPKKRARL